MQFAKATTQGKIAKEYVFAKAINRTGNKVRKHNKWNMSGLHDPANIPHAKDVAGNAKDVAGNVERISVSIQKIQIKTCSFGFILPQKLKP